VPGPVRSDSADQRAKSVLMSERDPSSREVVRRDLDRNAVAREDTDAEAAHVTAERRKHVVTVGQLHPERGVREHFRDRAFQLNRVFFRHPLLALSPEGLARALSATA